jgi:hypothetical protein
MSSLNINYSENFYLKRAIFAPYAQGKLPIEFASKKVPGQQINQNVARMTEVIEEYLGKDFSMIKKKWRSCFY